MKNKAGQEQFLLVFTPERWDAVKKFSTFTYEPLKNNRYFTRGTKATSDHLEKFKVLAEIGNDLMPGFDYDAEELDKDGYSPAKYSRKFAAVAECSINELYAALDGIRDVIYAVYSDVQGVQKKSTSKLFTKAKDREYGEGFPDEIRALLDSAHDKWFLELRKYRTEFTHGSLGSCSKDRDTGQISYMHSGLGSASKSLIINDFIGYINSVYAQCLQLQNNVFEFLFSELPLQPTKTLCGFNNGLAYMRSIEPEENLTINSGKCESTNYADPCPLKDSCKAYAARTIENKQNPSL